MGKVKDFLPYLLIAAAALMEWVLVTHIHNVNRSESRQSGVWSFSDLSLTMHAIFSWGVAIFVVVAVNGRPKSR
jgi:hypothetical protein